MTDAPQTPEAGQAPQAATGGGRFRGLGLRVITGVLLAVGAVALVVWAPLWLVGVIAGLGAAVGMYEYLSITGAAWTWGDMACLILALGLPVNAAQAGGTGLAAAMGLALILTALISLVSPGDLEQRLAGLRGRGWGLGYVGGLLGVLVVIAGLPSGRWLLLLLVAVVVAADTGAYFAGHLWGRHKLAPSVSPGKTVEGLLGGLALAAVLGALVSLFLLPDTPVWAGALLGLVLAGLSVAGDLLESLLKRVHGVKDSGFILPGHGGVLDRIDGLLAAGPALLLARVLWWS